MNQNVDTRNAYRTVLTKPGPNEKKKSAINEKKTTMISELELNRIKTAALSAEELLLRDEKNRLENSKKLAREKALEVRKMMKEIDKRNREQTKNDDDELKNQQFKTELQAQIANLKAEEIDEVKKMTSVANESRAIMVLNHQVDQKKRRKKWNLRKLRKWIRC